MAVNFPASPTNNQTFTSGGITWSYSTSIGAWRIVPNTIQGTSGLQGFQGIQGIQGTTGSQGIQGIQGTFGLQGFQGIQGTSIQGASGAGGGVTTFSAGSTGFTPSTATAGAVSLAGTLAIASGGTNGSATPTAGAVAYGTGSAYAFTTAGTTGQALVSNGGSAPAFTTLTLENLPGAWPKKSVRVATTGSITLSGTQTIDGVSVVVGDRVLVKNQGTASQNGIYIVASGSWTRAADADTADEIAGGTVNVDQGSTNFGELFRTDFLSTQTVGSNSMNWYRVVDSAQIGSIVQAYSARLADIAGLSPTEDNFIVGDGSNWIRATPSEARTALGLGSIATQSAGSVSITGGTITGITDLRVATSSNLLIGRTNSTVGLNTRLDINGAVNASAFLVNGVAVGGGGGVTSFSAGSTGLSPSSATTGAIVLSGTLDIDNGGTGSTSASGARNNLGLGSIATQDSSSVSISGGTITGITDLRVATSSNLLIGRTNSTVGLNTRLDVNGAVNASAFLVNGVALSGGGGGGVTSFSAGSTGLTPTTATTGAVTLAGTLDLDNGGTGSTTASGARTNLGLGSIATQSSSSVSISGGSITGITDLAVADGGTGASNKSGARTNLGISVGTTAPGSPATGDLWVDTN